MLGEKHDLVHEFPEHREKIHTLKTTDKHFARLFDEYHELEHQVRRAEEGVDTFSDEHMEDLKKKRLKLKDELYAMLVG